MILYIDTTKTETRLALYSGNQSLIDEHTKEMKFSQSEELLPAIDQLLRRNHTSKDKLRALIVNQGPGSYTGVRVGVTTANLLAFGLNIPVLPVSGDIDIDNLATQVIELPETGSFSEPVMPIYLRSPHITQSKKSS
ncbi:MAG: tRNA threonylcarbamoyladenosine biosynthesis protein TsaB [bacterium ADurb.Bin400]|nr:MAG: tRNA threonylcarbamoyladenosine biosynthesis protein TsaB [bacterium ADurb.Bin400]